MSGQVHPAGVSFVFRPIERWTGLDREPKSGPFKVTPARTQSDLRIELARIGVSECVIQADLAESDIRLDGMPRAHARYRSPRVVVSFEHPDQGQVAFPCGTYTDLWQNLRAIVKTMESLRAVDRYGVTQRSEQYTGWKQLPPPGSAIVPESPGASHGFSSVDDAARFLIKTAGVTLDDGVFARVIGGAGSLRRVYVTASSRAHPDKHGGDESLMVRVNAARVLIHEHQERAGVLP